MNRWICFLTALVVTFSLYPGWFFFDSSQQWTWARQFVDKGWPHSLKEYLVTSHWPIFNTLINVPFYWLTHEAGLYILVQAFLFNLCMYLVGRAIIGRRSLWLLPFTVVMVWSPICMNMSVFQSSDTVVAACALAMIAAIADREAGMAKRTVWIAIAAVLMSLLRYNALTAAVPLLAVFCWVVSGRLGWARATSIGIAVLLAIVVTVGAARAYEHTAYKRPSVAEGPALRLLEASRLTPDPVVHAVVDPLIRSNPKLRQPLAPECYVTGYWCAQIGAPWDTIPTRSVLLAYLHLATHEPLVFLRVNAHFAWYALGLAEPLEPRQIGRTDIMAPFPAARMAFNHRRMAMLSAFQKTLDLFGGLAARAGIIFLLGLVAVLCLRRRGLVVGYVVLSVGYAVPILLLASDTNFRYLFPVTITAMAILAAACCVFVRKILTCRRVRDAASRVGRPLFNAFPNDRTGWPRWLRARRGVRD